MRSKLKIIGIYVTVVTLLSVCGCTAPGEGDTKVKSAAQAKDAALSYLRGHNSENVPSGDIVWQEQDVTPPHWVGGVFKEFTSDEWTIRVSYPVVPLENTVYEVVVFNIKQGWHWKGTVEFDGSVTELSAFEQMSEEESQQIALDFLKKSPTFTFNGIENSIKLVRVEPAFCPHCWGFVYEFRCAHPGYGDRSGQILAQVITDHEAMIGVSMGEVDGGTIDGKWDMIHQREISGQLPEIKEAQHQINK